MLLGDCVEHLSELFHLKNEQAGVFTYQLLYFLAEGCSLETGPPRLPTGYVLWPEQALRQMVPEAVCMGLGVLRGSEQQRGQVPPWFPGHHCTGGA